MTPRHRRRVLGSRFVEHALRDADHDPITTELAHELSRRAKKLPAGAFRAWTLTQLWPESCAIVRIVSGEALRDELGDDATDEDLDEDMTTDDTLSRQTRGSPADDSAFMRVVKMGAERSAE